MDTCSRRKEEQPAAEPLLCLALNRAAFLRPREKTRLAALLRSPGRLLSLTRSALQDSWGAGSAAAAGTRPPCWPRRRRTRGT